MSARKYTNPDQRNIRQEKEVFEFIASCKLEHNAVYYMGASAIWALYGKTKALPEDLISRYSPYFENQDIPIFSDEALEQFYDFLQQKMKKVISEKESKQAQLEDEPRIRVWDKGSLNYVEIPESQFNPMFHKRA